MSLNSFTQIISKNNTIINAIDSDNNNDIKQKLGLCKSLHVLWYLK